MRLQGVVRCQYLFYKPGQIKKHGPIHKDMEINSDNFLFYPPVELSSWRILRNSGIKLIWAGFSDLSPVNPAVQQQRLENWRARWENEANLTKADNDLEVMRIRNRALAQAQRELIFQLMQIYETSSLSPEVLSLRIFQVLEGKASDPTTRQFVPREYLDFLRSLQAWLQPGETDPGSKSPANTS
jgi:hypothetical protein